MDIGVEFWKNHWGGKTTEIKNTYTKHSPLGHYFLLPNEIFTLGLSPGELCTHTCCFVRIGKRMFVILAFAKLGNTPA